jgi:cation:H+ antiporter
MLSLWGQLIFMLVIILVSAHLFTNAIEHFGEKNKLSEGVVGSVFASIATALPETMIPIIAIVSGSSDKTINEEISVGSILGAPLMLSTLAIFILGVVAIKRRGFKGSVHPEKKGFSRDLNFFLVAFSFATLAMYVPMTWFYLRVMISLALIALYLFYLSVTLKASKGLIVAGHGMTIEEPLLLTKVGFKNNKQSIAIQLLLGLLLLLLGAKGFINGVEHFSFSLGISALIISLLIVPIATELPEKVNSVIWIRKNKDTLAFGNITGAMVFQGCLLPALGILLTPWQPSNAVLGSLIVTFIAAAWLRLNASRKKLFNLVLLVNGLLYLVYLGLVLG